MVVTRSYGKGNGKENFSLERWESPGKKETVVTAAQQQEFS